MDDVAALMRDRFEENRFLEHLEAVHLITDAGGESYLRTNNNGNIAIAASVLKAFRSLTEGDAVWQKSYRAWREFDPMCDPPGTREQPL